MTMTYRIESFVLLAALAPMPLLTACPGFTGDLGDHGGEGSTGSSTTSPLSVGGSGSGASGAGSAGAESSGGGDSSGGGSGDLPCTKDECGPAPGIPSFLCQDGVTISGPGPCERGPDGTCGYPFVDCPPCCYAPEQPSCAEGSTCCADGTWACNDPGGVPTCDEGIECACCWEGDMPDCIGEATCCAGGVWACDDDAGMSTCEGDTGVVCDLPSPPPTDCCELADEPSCIEGTLCCSDGTWACNEPGVPPCDAGEICGGGACQMDAETCAGGESCCEGLECCSGLPVPPGMEFCSATCPISDRNRKENFEVVDTRAVLETLVQIPITTWNYTFEDPSIRHLGPMAQDFKAAFAVGATDKKIFQIDADGVALASIQALHAEVEALRAENARLSRQLAQQMAQQARIQQRLDGLEKAR